MRSGSEPPVQGSQSDAAAQADPAGGFGSSMDAREREIFLAVLDLEGVTGRAAFLSEACGRDVVLRARVEALLQEHESAGDFLSKPALGGNLLDAATVRLEPGSSGALARVRERAGDRIDRYRLVEPLGEGGCGVVFLADQEEPVRRQVALKVIKLGMDTRSVIARFEAERQALALMDHPNIARVLDAGATATGRPYFVMELVRGVPITDYCDEHRLSTRDRLGLFIQVCQAIQHAHQKGIIHRDLKPSNILVTRNEPATAGVPKIIDFGIAKATEQRLTEKTLFTEHGAFMGTPAYMSPEQAEMGGLDIDTRSDLYSLGVVLYQLLTGRTPFDAETLAKSGLDALRRTLRDTDPPRPSTRIEELPAVERGLAASQRGTEVSRLRHLLRGDLDWIVMKCLEKDRSRRFATANELALDLQRYLDGEAVVARPPSRTYRLGKLLRRHRLAVLATSGLLITLLAGIGVSAWQAARALKAEQEEARLRVQAERSTARAEQDRAAARLNEYVADVNLAQQSLVAGNYRRALQLLEKHVPLGNEPDLRGFEWRMLWQQVRGDEHTAIPAPESTALALAFSPDGRWLAAAYADQVRVWDFATRTPVTTLAEGALSLAFTGDGTALVTANRAGVRVWRVPEGSVLTTLPGAAGAVAVEPGGRWLATESPAGVQIWSTAGWQPARVLAGARGPMAFSRDAQLMVADSRAGLTVWSLADGRSLRVLQDSTNLFLNAGPWFRNGAGVVFTPDGTSVIAPRNLSSSRGSFFLSVWEVSSGREVASFPSDPERPEHTGVIASLEISPDGRTLVTASWDHSLRLWDLASRRVSGSLLGHVNEVWAAAFSPDGRALVSGAKGGGLNLWPLQRAQTNHLAPAGWVPLGFSTEARLLAFNPHAGSVAVFDPVTRRKEDRFTLERSAGSAGFPPAILGNAPPPGPDLRSSPPGPGDGPAGFMPLVAFSADFRRLVCSGADGTVEIRDAGSAETMRLHAAPGRIDRLLLSPDGRDLIVGGSDGRLNWWNLDHPTNAVARLEARRAILSPDGRILAAIAGTNHVELWDVATVSRRTVFTLDPAPGPSVALSPDGILLAATAGPDDVDHAVRLWDTDTGELLGACEGHKQPVWAIAFAPDGRTLASSSDDGTVKLWNLATRQELLSIRKPGVTARRLLFSPDGRMLLIAGGGPQAGDAMLVIQAPTLEEIKVAEGGAGGR